MRINHFIFFSLGVIDFLNHQRDSMPMVGTTLPPVRSSARSAVWIGLAVGLTAALAACATPDTLVPGTAEAAVRAQYGRPAAEHRLPAGKRLEYPIGAFEQTVWMVDLDGAGRVVHAEQVRTIQRFAQLEVGVATPEIVRTTFGTPWRIQNYKLSGLTAWLYPYREDGIWNSMVAVHFNDQGRLVRIENGPDPRFAGGGDRRGD